MNYFWIGAGVVNLVAFVLHLVVGYTDSLLPLSQTGLNDISMATIFAVWAMATLVMATSSSYLLYIGRHPFTDGTKEMALLWGWLYVAFGLIFVIINMVYGFFSLPQWILLLPIGILALMGRKNVILSR